MDVSAYWDNYNQNNTETAGKSNATAMNMLLRHLSGGIKGYLKSSSRSPKTILDYGCGIGKGTSIIKQEFEHCDVTGFDISNSAIDHNEQTYDDAYIQFKRSLIPKIDKANVVFISRVLCCYQHPQFILDELAHKIATNYIVTFDPYKEPMTESSVLYGVHKVSIDESTFPNRIAGGFYKEYQKLVEVPPEVYFGRTMLLTVYKKKEVAALGKYKVVFYGSFAEQSPQQLKILKDFISANKYCIVLTARDHKNNESIESIMDKFATVGLDKFVIGTTPTLNTYNDPISMTMKIDAWLEQNQGSVAQYVIMDDMSNMLHYNKTKLIKIENEITIMDTLKATAIMNKGSNY